MPRDRSKLRAILTSLLLSLSLGNPALAQWSNPGEEGGQNKAKAALIYQQAMQAFQMGDFNSTINMCKVALNFDHGNKHLVHLMALAMSESGDNYNAMMQFRAALTLDYNFIQCRNNYGMFLKKTGKTEEAKKQFQECIRIDPKYPDAYYHLGEILKEKGDIDNAIECFETATRLKPSYFEAQRDLGLAIYERASSGQGGDISDSLEKLQTAARLVPDNPMIWYHIATIYLAQSKLDEGEAMLRTALMRDPKLAAAHWELGKLRYFRGDPTRCLQEVREAQKINPVYTEGKKYPPVDPIVLKLTEAVCLELKDRNIESVEQWKLLASMCRDNSATLTHIADMEKNLRMAAKKKGKKDVPAFDPEEIEALLKKGCQLADDGNLEQAKATFQRALELNPQSFEATQHLGLLLESNGDLNGAMTKYQAAMQLRPKYDGLYYNFAYLLEKLNLPADAGMMYQKFHEFSGRYPYDPKHIVSLQQEDARARAKQEQLKKRGY